jgi:RHS repeat-associated protein
MEEDTEAGSGNDRYNDHARHHAAGLGRFLSVDLHAGSPADPQSWNRYTYGLNNPLKHVDPDGQTPKVIEAIGRAIDSVYNAIDEGVRSGFNHFFPPPESSPNDPNREASDDPSVGNTPAQTERLVNPAGAAQRGLNEGGATLTAEFAKQGVTQLAFAAVGGVIKLGSTGLELSEHAAARIAQRGVSLEKVESVVQTAKAFTYKHEGVLKTGYYDAASKIFVAAKDGRVRTVITNVKPKYIENLKGAR